GRSDGNPGRPRGVYRVISDTVKDLGDLRHRFDEFAARFSEHSRGAPRGGPAGAALSDDYWENVQELFTRDVTAKDFRDLLGYDTPDALRFFSREVDFAAL